MADKKSAKDLLKTIVAKVEGKKEEDVIFEDMTQNKRIITKKRSSKLSLESNTVDNGEGLKIIDIKVETEEWENIKSGRHIRNKKNLDEWGAYDFFYFTQKLYLDKYGEGWNLKVGGCSIEINRIRDKMADAFGFVSNLMMRDYIKFFFSNSVDYYKNSGGFYFIQMREDKNISYFMNHYDYERSFNAYMKNEKKIESSVREISSDEISKAFLAGNTTLICNYGIVVAINWFLLNKKMSLQKSLQIVEESFKILKNKGLIEVVKKSTELYSPYPSWLPFKTPQDIFEKSGYTYKLKISFSEDDTKQLSFLKKPFKGGLNG